MRTSPLSAITVAALLVVAGCAGLPSAGENEPSPDVSPDEFPNASAIDQSVFDTHATVMTNTSFTLTVHLTKKERAPYPTEKNFTYSNYTSQALVEPGASQYLEHTTGYLGNKSIYSNGQTEYVLVRDDDNRTEVREAFPTSAFNESSDRYLWRGWFNNESDSLEHAAIEATFQREGVETFQGVPVMRYEATGVDALADSWAGDGNTSSWFEEFSATLLLDENGVIRHYEYEFVWADYQTRRTTKAYTLSGVGSTDVEKPDWAANETVGS